MTSGLRALTRIAAAAIFTFGPARAAVGQDTLPPAEQIIARYHEAIGSAAFAAIQSLHSTGEIAIPAAGITGSMEIWQARPNRTLMHASVSGFGDVRTGHTGRNAWSVDPADGPRVLTGPEAAQAEDDAHFESHLRVRGLIASMSVVERTTLSGYDCYKVHTVWSSGRETMDCYSTESGLLVGSQRTHQGTTGPTEALIMYENYREFAGVRLPTRITTRIEGIEQIITLRDVELNAVADSAFTPPPEIRALLGS